MDEDSAPTKRPSIQPDASAAAEFDDVLAWLLTTTTTTQGELFNLLDSRSDNNDNNNIFEAAAAASGSTSTSGLGKVRFIDDPYSSLLVFQSSSSYITINGNEESCGSSFSDSGTSIMASVHMSTFNIAAGRPSCTSRLLQVQAEHCNGGFDWDDEVLARFLGEDEHLFSDKQFNSP